MLTAGFVVFALGVVLLLGASLASARQIGPAGDDPGEGGLSMASEDGVSKRTTALVRLGWVLLIVGAVWLLVALLV